MKYRVTIETTEDGATESTTRAGDDLAEVLAYVLQRHDDLVAFGVPPEHPTCLMDVLSLAVVNLYRSQDTSIQTTNDQPRTHFFVRAAREFLDKE